MFYYFDNDRCLLGESIPEVLRQVGEVPRWNLPYLQKLLQNGLWLDPELIFQTHFQNIFRVPLGYQLVHQLGRPPQLIRQWQLEVQSCPKLSLKDAQEQLLKHLTQAIMRVTPSCGVGVELSGGIDSSTISALTRQLYPNQNLHAFTHSVPSRIPDWMQSASFLYDESQYSHLVSKHLSLKQHSVGHGFNLDQVISQYSEWLGGCSEVLFPLLNNEVYSCAHSLQLKTLLSGFGGDEVVSQHANSAFSEWYDQKSYGHYVYERILKKYRNMHSGIGCIGKSRANLARRRQANSHWPFLFLDSVDTPKVVPLYRTVQAKEAAYIQGELSTHWQRRIETSKVIAKQFGIDCAFPLADPQLMSFFHQLPVSFKRRHGYGRYLLRKTVQEYLPSSVIWRCNKAGSTAPAAYAALIEQLPSYFLSRVDAQYDGILKSYVNIPKLRELFESGPTLDDAIVRLSVMVLMLFHYEGQLNSGVI